MSNDLPFSRVDIIRIIMCLSKIKQCPLVGSCLLLLVLLERFDTFGHGARGARHRIGHVELTQFGLFDSEWVRR